MKRIISLFPLFFVFGLICQAFNNQKLLSYPTTSCRSSPFSGALPFSFGGQYRTRPTLSFAGANHRQISGKEHQKSYKVTALLSNLQDDSHQNREHNGGRGDNDQRLKVIIRVILSSAIAVRQFRMSIAGFNQFDEPVERERKMYSDSPNMNADTRLPLLRLKLPPKSIEDQMEITKAKNALKALIEVEYKTLVEPSNFLSKSTGNSTYYDYRVMIPVLLDAFFHYSDPKMHAADGIKFNNKHVKQQELQIFDVPLASSIIHDLWYLPALSILSGIPPACRIVAESHISRLPDTPIAHDMDTLLLWPAVGNTFDRNLPPTLFQTPAAAITDVSQYEVNWDDVSNAFISNVFSSLTISSGIAVCLYFYLILGKKPRSGNSSLEDK